MRPSPTPLPHPSCRSPHPVVQHNTPTPVPPAAPRPPLPVPARPPSPLRTSPLRVPTGRLLPTRSFPARQRHQMRLQAVDGTRQAHRTKLRGRFTACKCSLRRPLPTGLARLRRRVPMCGQLGAAGGARHWQALRRLDGRPQCMRAAGALSVGSGPVVCRSGGGPAMRPGAWLPVVPKLQQAQWQGRQPPTGAPRRRSRRPGQHGQSG